MFSFYLLRGHWFNWFWLFFRIYIVLASVIMSFFLYYKIRIKNDALIQKKLSSGDFPKIIGIINIIVLVIIAIWLAITPNISERELFETIFLFSILTLGTIFVLSVIIHLIILLIVLYFLLFLIPLSVGSIVFTILQKIHLTKNNMIFNIILNSSIIVINYFYLNNIYFLRSIEKFIRISKGFVDGIIGFITLLIGSR